VLDALPLAALVVAGLWYWLSVPAGAGREAIASVTLDPISVQNADQLQDVFQRHEYDWVPKAAVPLLAIKDIPQDIGDEPIALKKSLFFRSILPLVLAENRRIRMERDRIASAFDDGDFTQGSPEWKRVAAIAQRYDVDADLNDPDVRERLRRRVDEIPPSLALAQAANESAWGTSRFAREGNNLYGEWTWNADKGIVPKRRAEGADHFVRRFDSLRASVRSYLNNLNTHQAYAKLRSQRRRLREIGTPVTGMRLAGALDAYSERGMAYVNDIRNMIAYNRLQRINDARLATPSE